MEQKNELTPAFINEKDVSTDFIYDMFEGFGEFIEHINKEKTHIVGYWNGRLIEAKWYKHSNRIAFAFVDMMENHHTDKDVENLVKFISDVDTDNTGLVVEVWHNGGWILSDWYFKN